MIESDLYIDNFKEITKSRLENNSNLRISTINNFYRLSSDQKVIQINISIILNENLIVKEKIDWNLNFEKRSPFEYASKLVNELVKQNVLSQDLLNVNIKSITNQILDEILELLGKFNNLSKPLIFKKEVDYLPSNTHCVYCDSVLFNSEFCINCRNLNEKRETKRVIFEQQEEFRQTERQRIIEFKQKNSNFEEVPVSYSLEGKEKKICKKCGEINHASVLECRACKFKFPAVTYFDLNMDYVYSLNFWHKINKNSTIQQLKNFSDYFYQQDFNSLIYLYNKIKCVIKQEFEEMLTEEAYSELLFNLDRYYTIFSKPTKTTDKIFENSYCNKFNKNRVKTKIMNFNHLVDIKEGWLNDNVPDKNYDEKKEEFKYLDPNFKRKRGRPRKMEIFKNDEDEVIYENPINLIERDNLLKNDLISEEDMNYDFCGICEDEGKLICCETCSASYHFECLGYDRFPRGKFKCYFCKIVKVGIDDANTIDENQIKIIKKLITFNRKSKWQEKADEFLTVLSSHHCSCFFKDPIPVDFIEFNSKFPDFKDLQIIEKNLIKKKYANLRDFIKDIAYIWNCFKEFYKPNSFLYKQANTMEIFMTHLITNEGIFDNFNPDGGQTLSSSKRERSDYKIKGGDIVIDLDREIEVIDLDKDIEIKLDKEEEYQNVSVKLD